MTTTTGQGRRVLRALALSLLLTTASACASPEQKVERYTKSGYAYLEKGDTGKANIQFLSALKIDENHVPALMGLADLYEKKQDFQNLFGVLQTVVRLQPDNRDALVKIGKLYLIGGDEQQAMDAADKVLKLEPENVDATALKAAVYLKLDDKARAVELARKALAKNPKNPEAVAVIATERVSAGDAAAGLAEVDRALKLDQKVAVLHLLRLQILQIMQKPDEMLAGYKVLIANFPDVVGYRQLYVRALLDAKKLPEAREQLVEIQKLQPGKIDPMLDVVRMESVLGGKEAASKAFDRFLTADPKNVDLRLAYAAYKRQIGEYAESEKIYQELAKSKDKAIELRARNEIAAQRFIEGKTDEGKAIVDEVLAKDPRNTDALIKRAGLKIDDKKYDDAVADLRTALADKPDSTPAKLLLATAFERRGDLDLAKTEMAKAVEESKNEPTAANVFAKLLVRTNDPARAREVLETSLKSYPDNADNLKLLAAVQLIQQDWKGAEASAKSLEAANAADPTVNRILGAAYAGLNDYGGVIDKLGAENARQALTGQPLAALIDAYVRDNRVADGESLLRGMIAANKGAYDARILLAQVLDIQKKKPEVEAALREAYAVDRNRPEAVENLYRLMQRDGRGPEILPFLDGVIAEAPDNYGARYMKGDYLIQTGQNDAAIAVYGDILQKRPNDLLAVNNYASLITETREDKQSLARALEVAKKLADSQNPYFLDTLGWAQFKNGDVGGAQATLEKALTLVNGFAEGHYHLGAVYMASGDKARAQAELNKAVAASPAPEVAAKARALLAQNR